ncbi:MAG: hypothetical protein ACRDOH_04735 [Streptosporangiaceae bacterium]
MTLGQAGYHTTKPWMPEQDLYRAVGEFLAEWANDQDAGCELFHIIGRLHGRSTNELRELLTLPPSATAPPRCGSRTSTSRPIRGRGFANGRRTALGVPVG